MGTTTAWPQHRPVARRRSRRPLRRLTAALTALALAGVLLLVGAWFATPDVGDARARVDASLAAHSAPALAGAAPAELATAVIATEDSSFRGNPGVDLRGVLRAGRGVLGGEDLGGSTLEQQLAKNLYEDGGQGAVERGADVVLAVKLARVWSKDQLLAMYLDDGYYGHGFYGVTAAAEGYFGVPPGELDWAQSSLLAGLLQAPSAYDPLVHPDRAAARQAHVLDRLVTVGALTRARADQIAGQRWGLAGAR